MPRIKDLTGAVFGRLTVIGLDKNKQEEQRKNKKYRTYWICQCSCKDKTIASFSSRLLKNGDTQSCGCLQKERVKESARKRFVPNVYDLSREYGIGYVSNTGKEFYFDLEDYDKIKDFRWYEEKRDGYIVTVSGKKHIKLHQFVCNNIKYLDHINRNKRDNRKSNLRESNKSLNEMNKGPSSRNKSGVVGVSFNNRDQKWIAQIKKENDHRMKYFISKEEAIKQRFLWEQELFGEFAGQKHLHKEHGIDV